LAWKAREARMFPGKETGVFDGCDPAIVSR
jgi:hypothetical protein